MSYRVTKVRRDAIPGQLDALLHTAHVGQRVHLTFYGVPSDAVITELDDEWVTFTTDDEEQQ